MDLISDKMRNINFSGIGKMVNLANSIGGDMVRLEIGDVDYAPPKCVKESMTEAFDLGQTHYPPFKGYSDLIELVVDKLNKENKINASPDNVLITSGGSAALYVTLASMINPGDEVIITDPVWCHFPNIIKLAGGIPKYVSLDPNRDFQIDIEELKGRISKNTKAILINSPNNPTGAVLNKENCKAIADLAGTHNIPIISDEEYEAFVFGNNKHVSIGSIYDNAITLQSFSKTYAMSGYRLGYIVADKSFIDALSRVNLYTVMYASSISQRAAVAAMKNKEDFVNNMVKEFENRMNFLVDELNSIEGISCEKSQGSVYVWPNTSKLGMSSIETAKFLIEKAKVVTVAGSEFGENGEGYLRISLGAKMDKLKEGVRRINEAVEKYV